MINVLILKSLFYYHGIFSNVFIERCHSNKDGGFGISISDLSIVDSKKPDFFYYLDVPSKIINCFKDSLTPTVITENISLISLIERVKKHYE